MECDFDIFLNIIRQKLQNILPKPAFKFSFDSRVLNVYTCELLHSGERYSANKVLLSTILLML